MPQPPNPPLALSPKEEQTLPHDLPMEQALLSILLYKNQTLEDISDILQEEDFFSPRHQTIFKAIRTFYQKHQLANPITLAPLLKQKDEEAEAYLFQLGSMMIPSIHARDYARRIHDYALRRALISLSETMNAKARDFSLENQDGLEQIEFAEKNLFDLAVVGKQNDNFQPFSQSLMTALESAETAFKRDSHIIGVTSGLRDLDKLLGGFFPSDLIILAARPSMGKTALATNIAFNAAKAYMDARHHKDGAKVAFFSLEMSAEQLAMRLLGQESGIPSDRIRRGAIGQEDFPNFVKIAQTISDLPLFIDDTPALSVHSIRTRARRLHRTENISLIIIDYLQLITSGSQKFESRVQELSEITRNLKALAKELGVPVIALSQLSRAVEQREDKRPQLADLRESGSIEQDADVVIFIFREEYYESRKKPSEGSDKMLSWQKNMEKLHNTAELVIAKQRHGPIATIPLYFDGRRTKFSDLQKEE